jgi:CDP-diacylglycerol--glycerol-3-phosphate 3-phosphatidyltransferase
MSAGAAAPARAFPLANAITLSRLVLLAVAVALLYSGRPPLLWAALVLTVVIILLDGIDGIVARRRGEASKLGGVLDIAIDRVVENVYWIAFVGLALVPVWVALVVVTRGILTDAVRGFVLARGDTAFGMMQSGWGRAIVSSRFMRGAYGLAKAVAFAAVIALYAVQQGVTGQAPPTWLPALEVGVYWWVVLTVALTVVRGAPVLVEARRYL